MHHVSPTFFYAFEYAGGGISPVRDYLFDTMPSASLYKTTKKILLTMLLSSRFVQSTNNLSSTCSGIFDNKWNCKGK